MFRPNCTSSSYSIFLTLEQIIHKTQQSRLSETRDNRPYRVIPPPLTPQAPPAAGLVDLRKHKTYPKLL